MKITSAEFVLGVADLAQLPRTDLQEIALLGRSNVGKSSLLNMLCHRKALARSSATPGKTRELNFYIVNNSFYFVDLPGYGYARVPEHVKSSWGNTIERYLKERKQLAFAIQVVDARHDPTEIDLVMGGWLDYYEVPFLVALTKSDKLARSKADLAGRAARQAFSRYGHFTDIILSSSVKGTGRSELLGHVAHAIQ